MSTTTTRPRDVEDRNPTTGLTGKLTEADSHFIAGSSDRSFGEDRRTRAQRRRLVGFVVCIALWALTVIPLARENIGGREGVAVVLFYVAAAAISLGIAVAIRGVYIALRRDTQFWSPVVFLIAAVLAIMSYGAQTAGQEEVPIAGAAAQVSDAGGGSGA
jgi:hypothetical protein